MSFDLQKVLESKAAHRRKLADLPIGEMLRLLDSLRQRAIGIRRSSPQPGSCIVREDPTPYRAKRIRKA